MKNKPIIILGAGGHAKVVANILELSGRRVLGFVSPDFRKHSVSYFLDALGDSQHFQVWVNTRGYGEYSVGGCEASCRLEE